MAKTSNKAYQEALLKTFPPNQPQSSSESSESSVEHSNSDSEETTEVQKLGIIEYLQEKPEPAAA